MPAAKRDAETLRHKVRDEKALEITSHIHLLSRAWCGSLDRVGIFQSHQLENRSWALSLGGALSEGFPQPLLPHIYSVECGPFSLASIGQDPSTLRTWFLSWLANHG